MTTTASSAPGCEVCDGSGWYYIGSDKLRGVKRCECRIVSSDVKVRSILPPLLHEARLSDFAQPLLCAGRRWLEQPTNGLLLTGPTGTGKTWLGAAIVRALVERGKTVAFRCGADFYADLRATFNSSPDVTEHTVLSQFAEVEFLFFDDVGSGSLSDYERRSTLHVLDRRLNHLRPTIVTTNLSLEQVAQGMDERIASRLSGFTRIAMTGRDRRGRS